MIAFRRYPKHKPSLQATAKDKSPWGAASNLRYQRNKNSFLQIKVTDR